MADIQWVSLIGGGLCGSVVTIITNRIRGRVQKMKCFLVDDDVLSKIPLNTESGSQQNLYQKTFKLKNTTNIDINFFQVRFQFDPGAIVTDCYSKSKEGYNKQKIKPCPENDNQAIAHVKDFIRGDEIEYTIKVANVSDNKYYVTESKTLGFHIKCKKKLKKKLLNTKESPDILVIK